jgi:hypothetical protein
MVLALSERIDFSCLKIVLPLTEIQTCESYQIPKTKFMKTNELVIAISFLKKLSKLALITALILPGLSLKSQESSSKALAVYPTIGFGIGFFYPKDVNKFIEDEITSSYTSTVNTELYMYYEIKGGVTFRLKNVDFSGLLEYDIAPKFVIVKGGGDNITYGFSRFSPEISTNFYIPNKTGKNAFFIGAGVNYSFMKFKDFSASNPGFKLQAGYSLQFGKLNLQPYAAFRYVKAIDSSDVVWGTDDEHSNFELNYTGGQIGVVLSFHPRINYK